MTKGVLFSLIFYGMVLLSIYGGYKPTHFEVLVLNGIGAIMIFPLHLLEDKIVPNTGE